MSSHSSPSKVESDGVALSNGQVFASNNAEEGSKAPETTILENAEANAAESESSPKTSTNPPSGSISETFDSFPQKSTTFTNDNANVISQAPREPMSSPKPLIATSKYLAEKQERIKRRRDRFGEGFQENGNDEDREVPSTSIPRLSGVAAANAGTPRRDFVADETARRNQPQTRGSASGISSPAQSKRKPHNSLEKSSISSDEKSLHSARESNVILSPAIGTLKRIDIVGKPQGKHASSSHAVVQMHLSTPSKAPSEEQDSSPDQIPKDKENETEEKREDTVIGTYLRRKREKNPNPSSSNRKKVYNPLSQLRHSDILTIYRQAQAAEDMRSPRSNLKTSQMSDDDDAPRQPPVTSSHTPPHPLSQGDSNPSRPKRFLLPSPSIVQRNNTRNSREKFSKEALIESVKSSERDSPINQIRRSRFLTKDRNARTASRDTSSLSDISAIYPTRGESALAPRDADNEESASNVDNHEGQWDDLLKTMESELQKPHKSLSFSPLQQRYTVKSPSRKSTTVRERAQHFIEKTKQSRFREGTRSSSSISASSPARNRTNCIQTKGQPVTRKDIQHTLNGHIPKRKPESFQDNGDDETSTLNLSLESLSESDEGTQEENDLESLNSRLQNIRNRTIMLRDSIIPL